MLLPFWPLELCLFSIAYKSVCFASFAFTAGDEEKTELKYPLGGGAAAPAVAAAEGPDFFLASMSTRFLRQRLRGMGLDSRGGRDWGAVNTGGER